MSNQSCRVTSSKQRNGSLGSLQAANRQNRLQTLKTTGNAYKHRWRCLTGGILTDGRVVDVQRFGRHELTHQRRLAHAGGTHHGDAKRLSDARAAGAARLSGRRQRRAGAGSRRARIRTAADPDHRVVRGRQVFGTVKTEKNGAFRRTGGVGEFGDKRNTIARTTCTKRLKLNVGARGFGQPVCLNEEKACVYISYSVRYRTEINGDSVKCEITKRQVDDRNVWKSFVRIRVSNCLGYGRLGDNNTVCVHRENTSAQKRQQVLFRLSASAPSSTSEHRDLLVHPTARMIIHRCP